MVGILLLAAALVVAGLAWLGPSAPGVTWPAAIAPIATFVSYDRGLAFLHTVPVHLQTPKVFDADVARQTAPASAATRASLARYAAELRALGLLNGGIDLAAAEAASDNAGGVLGYYTPTTKALYLRGRTLTPAVEVTLAHELTHALQDQHFGLNRLDRQAVTAGRQFALTALEEGDAVLDEDDYQASLPPAERRRATTQPTTAGGGGGAGPGGDGSLAATTVPVLTVTGSVPYVLGPDLVNALYAVGGNRAVDAAYRDPPTTELDVLDPVAYLRQMASRPVAAPALPAGDHRLGGSQGFGAFTLYLTLAGHLPARTALAAADGWAGGSMVQFTTAGRTCLRANLIGRTPADTTRLAAALSTWAARMPPGLASTTRTPGGPLRLAACDPGQAAQAGPGTLDAALTLADQRNQNQVDALYAEASPAIAGCVGNRAIDDRPLLEAEAGSRRHDRQTAHRQLARLIRHCSG